MRLLQQAPVLLAASLVAPSAASTLRIFHQEKPRPQGEGQAALGGRQASDASRAEAVKEAFAWSWQAYYDHAFPHDSLQPVKQSYEDDRNGWGVTPVDTLSTAIILDDEKTVNQILDFVPTIDFTTTAEANEDISVFESTIRYLGGLLSAYDLLNGPKKHLVRDSAKLEALLEQATSLADGLKVGFDTPSGVPDGVVRFNPDVVKAGSRTNSIAGFGTLVLEWTRLSDLTGNPEYAELAQKGEEYILDPRPESSEPFPGLVGHQVSVEDGKFQDNTGGWSGGTDSFYEYLIKMYVYDPDEFDRYKDRWILAADSSIKYLASHPTSREDLTFLSQYAGTNTEPASGHLACFDGGNFIFGGTVLGESKYVDFGLELVDSCIQVYQQTASGIGPEGFRWVDSAQQNGTGRNPLPPSQYADFYETAGFWPTSSAYILRPETLESVYYAYRATGDAKWQDVAWEAFEALNRTCRVETGGFAGLSNVMAKDGGGFTTKMESFWLAETLKYLYLIFAEDDADFQVQPDGANKFVFNTEAHPVKVRG